MAKKSRKSTKSILMTGAAITGGLIAGAVAVPKLAAMVAPTVDDKTINLATIGLGILGAMNTKGEIQTGFIAMAGGAGASLISEVAGLGYVLSPTYDVNRIIGASDNYSGTTWANPGGI